MTRGLILEGGAMRGMFTCGVLDVFMEENIRFDAGAGISAGALFGINYKSKQIGRGVRYTKKYCKDWRFCSFKSLIKTGDLYGVDFCYHTIPDELDPFDRETFAKDPFEFYVGATNLETGKVIFHKCTDGGPNDVSWLQASASMPAVSRFVHVDGYTLLDGGIICPIPYEFVENLGLDKNVAVLTQPETYVKHKTKAGLIYKTSLRKYPDIAKIMDNRHNLYNEMTAAIKEREASGRLFVIRPPEALGIKRTENNPDELERVYQMGRSEALKRLPELKEYLAN